MAPSTQTALILPDKFATFKLELITVPRPGPGEVLVKIQSVGMNPMDWKARKFNVLVESYPVVIGSDVAGNVEELGEGVTNVSVGDRLCNLRDCVLWVRALCLTFWPHTHFQTAVSFSVRTFMMSLSSLLASMTVRIGQNADAMPNHHDWE
jgi:hypothetical protein